MEEFTKVADYLDKANLDGAFKLHQSAAINNALVSINSALIQASEFYKNKKSEQSDTEDKEQQDTEG